MRDTPIRTRQRLKWLGCTLLFGLVFATPGFALPPLQHAVRGVIQSVGFAEGILVLADPSMREERIYVWNSRTRFKISGTRCTASGLAPGISIRGYYRMESGRFVLREVRWEGQRKEDQLGDRSP
jgi:hypothetical protein